MAILQGIEVTILSVIRQGTKWDQQSFEELPVSTSQKNNQTGPTDQAKHTSCFLSVKENQYFAVSIKVLNAGKWLQKCSEADTVRVEVHIDGGSLTKSESFLKSDLRKKQKVINRFIYRDVGSEDLHLSRATFEKRTENKCDIRFLDEPGPKDGRVVVKVTQGRARKRPSGGPTQCLPEKGVSKSPSKALLNAGVTLFAAPDINQVMDFDLKKYPQIDFLRLRGSEELQFVFSYRSQECLFQHSDGQYRSRNPAKVSRFTNVQAPTNIPQLTIPTVTEASQQYTPASSPLPDSPQTNQKRSRPEEPEANAHPACLSLEELAAKKAAWLEQDDEDTMDLNTFKRMKRELSSASVHDVTNHIQVVNDSHEIDPIKPTSALPFRSSPMPSHAVYGARASLMNDEMLTRELRKYMLLDECDRREEVQVQIDSATTNIGGVQQFSDEKIERELRNLVLLDEFERRGKDPVRISAQIGLDRDVEVMSDDQIARELRKIELLNERDRRIDCAVEKRE